LSQRQQLQMAARDFDLKFSGLGALSEVFQILRNDLLGVSVGVGENLLGLIGGIVQVEGGIFTRDVARIRSGFADFAAALVPRFGYYSGPRYGLTGVSPRTLIDIATLHHDRLYEALGTYFSPRATYADSRLLRTIWSGHDLGPFGQVYRVALTVGFAAKIATQEALGRSGALQ
jgi:hypothetical protein